MNTNKEEKVVCYYHNDMDGIMSASIVKKIYPNADFRKVDYGDVWSIEVTTNALVIVVDFSFADMVGLKNNCKLLCWIDHHKTAMDKNQELWESEDIDGLRNITKAGCELTWEWFFPNEPQPRAVDLVGDRDMWIFKYADQTRAFHEAASLRFKNPDENLLKSYLIQELLDQGILLIEKKNEQVRKSFEQGIDGIFCGYKARMINTNFNISETGEMCYKNMGYPVAFMWSMREGKIICSLRSNTVDVRELAEMYGGGGHKAAAGFSVTMKKLISILNAK